MIPKWTGELVGKMHINDISIQNLADKTSLNPKYVGMILNGKKTPPGAEERLNKAVDEIIQTKVEN